MESSGKKEKKIEKRNKSFDSYSETNIQIDIGDWRDRDKDV
jgi:hypothetical protein